MQYNNNIYKIQKQSKNNIMYDDYQIVTTKYKIMTKKITVCNIEE